MSLGATEMLAQVGWRSLAGKEAVMSGDCKILRVSGESWGREKTHKRGSHDGHRRKRGEVCRKKNPTGPIKGMFVSSLRGFS